MADLKAGLEYLVEKYGYSLTPEQILDAVCEEIKKHQLTDEEIEDAVFEEHRTLVHNGSQAKAVRDAQLQSILKALGGG